MKIINKDNVNMLQLVQINPKSAAIIKKQEYPRGFKKP